MVDLLCSTLDLRSMHRVFGEDGSGRMVAPVITRGEHRWALGL